MTKKLLKTGHCSQMSNPSNGTGNGGDRCTEACAAIIAKTYNFAGPWPGGAKASGEDVMYWFTQMLNKGSNVSALEDAAWINKWYTANSGGKLSLNNVHNPGFGDIQQCVDRSHIAVGGFNNYASLRLYSGGNPYKWTDPQALGHVLIICGYDTSHQSVWVTDPLRADPSGQPAEYSWASFIQAQFSDLSEVNGPTVSSGGGITTIGSGLNDFLKPNAAVVDFCVALDAVEQVTNPFNVTPQQDTINAGPVNFSFADPISWLSAVSNAFFNDFSAIAFRFLIVLIGVVMLIALVRSWIPPAGSSVASSVSTAAALA